MLQKFWRAITGLVATNAILPRSLHILSGILCLAVPLAAGAAACASRDYRGITRGADACKSVSAPPKPTAPTGCGQQLEQRKAKIDTLLVELEASCSRSKRLRAELTKHPRRLKRIVAASAHIRPALRAEEGVVAQSYSRLVELIGTKPSSLNPALPVALTLLLGFAAVALAGAHARRLGIPRLSSFAEARWPFWISTSLTFVVGAFVMYRESFDASKDGFDWCSYCLAGQLNSALQIAGPV